MASRAPPDYYAILEVPETASQEKIRAAYKRAALKTHPDRVSTNHPDRPARTRKFQLVNDAYYTLSDPSRRREYDAQRRLFPRTSASSTGSSPDPFADPFADFDHAAPPPYSSSSSGGSGFPFSWAWDFFSGGRGGAANSEEARAKAEEAQFADIFEEMLNEEGMRGNSGPGSAAAQESKPGRFWGAVGGVSGGALGFIVGNVPGMVMGAAAGNRLGAVRDEKGKSVYEVFQELPADDKAKLLAALAAKVLSHSVGI
ncbi:hypothetical protein TD95_001823 [Thielaviopsis punctulata]|uniref:J domain-containing protein n=1 Tax=Thielaviopsis punctulata TaxID=72032 RepID=A0A0F4ZBJ2_9PEZI|nr:hypothetical protein TD95_001823 [Thielaviopsis punctulata]